MNITDLVYIDDTGYHFADYPSFLSWLQDVYRGIFGADVYLGADSQDGQWIAAQAKAYFDIASIGASVVNSFSPATAQGVGLARNVKINGLTKKVATHSTVDVLIVGQPGTTLTGAIASDALNQKWLIPNGTIIPGGGSITVTATAEQEGDLTAAANTITTIFTPTRGWQTVNNPDDATPGAPVETDAELRIRQSISTANPSLTVFEGTMGAVLNVAGVQKARGYENDTETTDANGIPEHSISVVVEGGVSADIAQAIQIHKTPGTGTYGDTTVLVYDSKGMPINIRFERATTATIQVTIALSAGVNWSSNYEQLIKNAVAAVINEGEIGNDVLITKLYAPAYLNGSPAGQTYDIATITLGKNGGGQSAANVSIDWNENPVCDPDTDILVVVT